MHRMLIPSQRLQCVFHYNLSGLCFLTSSRLQTPPHWYLDSYSGLNGNSQTILWWWGVDKPSIPGVERTFCAGYRCCTGRVKPPFDPGGGGFWKILNSHWRRQKFDIFWPIFFKKKFSEPLFSDFFTPKLRRGFFCTKRGGRPTSHFSPLRESMGGPSASPPLGSALRPPQEGDAVLRLTAHLPHFVQHPHPHLIVRVHRDGEGRPGPLHGPRPGVPPEG